MQSTSSPHDNKELIRRIASGTISGSIYSFVRVATRLITIPVVIAHVGLDGYGIWAIIMAVTSYMRLGIGGVRSAFQKYVAESTGEAGAEQTSRLLSTGSAALLGLSLLGLAPAAWFAGHLARLSGVPNNFLSSASASLSLLALTLIIANAGSVYEAILMGAHRVDLVAKWDMFFACGEAAAIILLLRFGHGLYAMAAVMATSEVIRVGCFFVLSRRILPAVHVTRKFLSAAVVPELLRFAASYQVVGILEVAYQGLLPLAVLRCFGASAAGVFSVSTRLTWAALTVHQALLLPLLSGAAHVHTSGTEEELGRIVQKGIKATLLLTLPVLVLLGVIGRDIVMAWTGRSDHAFGVVIWLTNASGLFASFSILGMVVYRATGGTWNDLLRQVVRIGTVVAAVVLARHWTFYVLLAGFVASELLGMMVMMSALRSRIRGMRVRVLISDTAKLVLISAAVIALAELLGRLPFLPDAAGRQAALFRIAVVSFSAVLMSWPALILIRFFTRSEEDKVSELFSHFHGRVGISR